MSAVQLLVTLTLDHYHHYHLRIYAAPITTAHENVKQELSSS